ncbi:MAG: hypothetical protein HZA50_18505 [Planctomycetes bacterium]|nr:hypothetical protein [Planctomycetota bacterium]
MIKSNNINNKFKRLMPILLVILALTILTAIAWWMSSSDQNQTYMALPYKMAHRPVEQPEKTQLNPHDRNVGTMNDCRNITNSKDLPEIILPTTTISLPASINTGFVFIGGKYLESPYTVTVKDENVLINDVVMYHRNIKKETTTAVATHNINSNVDPGVPSWVNENTKIKDILDGTDGTRIGPIENKWLYLVKTRPPKEAAYAIRDYVQSLPCIKEAKIKSKLREDTYNVSIRIIPRNTEKLPEYGIVLEYAGNDTFLDNNNRATSKGCNFANNINIVSSKNDSEEKNAIYDMAQLIIEWLDSNGVIMYSQSSSPTIMAGKNNVASEFPLILETLKGKKTKKDKISIIERMGYSNAEELVNNYMPSEQLDRRIKDLVEESGIVPMKIEEVPEDIKSQIKAATQKARIVPPDEYIEPKVDPRVKNFKLNEDLKKLITVKRGKKEDELRAEVIGCAPSKEEIQAWQDVLNKPWDKKAVEFAGKCLMEDWDKVPAPPLRRPIAIFNLLAHVRVNEKPLATGVDGKPLDKKLEEKRVGEVKKNIDAVFDGYYKEISNPQSRWSKDDRNDLINSASRSFLFLNDPTVVTESLWAGMAADEYFRECMLAVVDTNANEEVLKRLMKFRESPDWSENDIRRIDSSIKSAQHCISRSEAMRRTATQPSSLPATRPSAAPLKK